MAGSPQTDECEDTAEAARCEGITDGSVEQVTGIHNRSRFTVTVVLGKDILWSGERCQRPWQGWSDGTGGVDQQGTDLDKLGGGHLELSLELQGKGH